MCSRPRASPARQGGPTCRRPSRKWMTRSRRFFASSPWIATGTPDYVNLGYTSRGLAKQALMRLSRKSLAVFRKLGLVVLYVFLVMWWVVASSHIYSVPIYSPNQKMAVRIDANNPGELGGPTNDFVELFWAHDFNSAVVFSGEWKSVDTANLRWRR